jgi:ring-1,2-phenylacetyl-CoA epoxidase subunit PaaB
VSIWVVASTDVTASDPDDSEAFFGSIDKPYRHATHYEIPDEVGQM